MAKIKLHVFNIYYDTDFLDIRGGIFSGAGNTPG